MTVVSWLWILASCMANTIKIIVESEGFQCQMCQTQWIPRKKDALPRRCPNQECRSMKWDATRYPNARPPEPTGPNTRTAPKERPIRTGIM